MIGLVVLNGASSAGKTSLARALQARFGTPWIFLEEDAFVQNTLDPRFEARSLDDPTLERTLRGYYRSIRAFRSVGFEVVADLGLYTEPIAGAFVEETEGLPKLVVGLHCDPDELDRRERLRGDRPIGLGRNQATTIHHRVRYDLEVDTTDGDLARCVSEFLSLVENR